MSKKDATSSRAMFLLSTIPVLLLLLAALVQSSGQMVHARLLALGEELYPGYGELRPDPREPTCDPKASCELSEEAAPKPKPKTEDDELLDDLFDEGDDGGETTDEPAKSGDEELLDDLFDDEGSAGEGDGGGVPAGVLRDEPSARETRNKACENLRNLCQKKWADYEDKLSRRTSGLLFLLAIDHGFETIVMFGSNHLRDLLVLLLMLCAATATWKRAHIALRPVRTRRDDRVSEVAQLVANLMLVGSARAFLGVQETAGATQEHTAIQYYLMAGFGVMAAFNVWHLIRPREDLESGGRFTTAPLAIPLYTTMGLIAGFYFFVRESHAAGLSIYLGKLIEHPTLYIQVGLFVWIGMMLKGTRIVRLFFDLLRPWHLPPAIMAFVVVVAAAVPTAYSGASGIFVIAVGAVIYTELRRAGARRQLALAASAMSGSMGVVLSPCLLVVVVASLNKEVTTDQLYGWGIKVFLLSAGLFLIGSLLSRREPIKIASPREALPAMSRKLLELVPYVIIAAVVLLFYGLVLDKTVDEHSASYILPVVLLALLVYDRKKARKLAAEAPDDESEREEGEEGPPLGILGTLNRATGDTSGLIGALLALMGLSVCLGGVIERSELMAVFPETFGSAWLTMTLLVVVLVIIGMIMDPYGAVILVTATIANVAYRNGIEPVHFWMVVLAAFELGYLTPPVALNHLLTRQVVGDTEHEADPLEQRSFWWRHERILLPISVMGVRFIIVAYLPLFWYAL